MPFTEGEITIYNDNFAAITTSVTGNVKMKSAFPSPSNINAGESVSANVSTSGGSGYASFDVDFSTGQKMHIQIAQDLYSVKATPELFPEGKSAALLAPGNPLASTMGFHLRFFNGPGLLQSLADSFIQANLPALLQYVKANPIKIKIHDNLDLTINSIALATQDLKCVYASLLPPSGNSSWSLNAMLRVGKGTVDAQVAWKKFNMHFNFSLTDAVIWTRASFDSTLQTIPQIRELQMSLDGFGLTGEDDHMIESILDGFGARTASRIAGLINTQLNAMIIDKINQILNNIKLSSSTAPNGHPSVVSPPPLITSVKTIGKDLNTWMSDPKIQSMELGQLKLPGTHDSGTYNLSNSLSQVSYSDIAFLWAVSRGDAPANGKFPITTTPTESDPLFIGGPMYDWIMGTAVNSISRTQDLTIIQQLQAGIRHFDFRVYYDTCEHDFYLQHALRGPSFRDVLTQVQTFLSANSDASELVFVYVSHTNFNDDKIKPHAPELADLVKSVIPAQHIYYQPVPNGQSQFDLQTLHMQTVGGITNGTSKIMIMCPDFTFTDTITNTAGYGGVQWTHELYTVDELVKDQGDKTKDHPDHLWAVNWVLGADTKTIVHNILMNLTDVPAGSPKFALKDIAASANTALPDFLDRYGPKYNLVTVDWLQYGLASGVPELIIGKNTN